MSRTLRRCSAVLALAAPLLGAAPAAATTGPITLATPGYELRMATDRLTLTTVRAGRTVLATAAGAFRFRIGADWYLVREVADSARDGDTLRVTAATDLPGVAVDLRITLRSDRYDVTWSLTGATADALSTAYDLKSAGHWYGHGENSDHRSVARRGPRHGRPRPRDTRGLCGALGITPAFVNLKANGAAKALKALHHAS
ncbi:MULTISPECIES: hypothetical protein [Streptomyces violaceusniger group]|uniref:hypothetical protein n=1 Tax=Streptomyces violaceusniger group TaxID=2839105 RepID=UPI00117D72AF|nr:MULTISPECIES: hypothetical protein [Streptomyces violaceusniger group]